MRLNDQSTMDVCGGMLLPPFFPITSERNPADTLCVAQPNVLDSIITKLLVTTKQLLQGLEQWSQGIISEEDVSAGLPRVSSRLTQRRGGLTARRSAMSMSSWGTGSSTV